MLLWLYGSISLDILDMVMIVDATMRTIWLNLKHLLCDNKQSRAIQLEAAF